VLREGIRNHLVSGAANAMKYARLRKVIDQFYDVSPAV
jgi:hypothetical protein